MKAAKENGTNIPHENLSQEIVVQQPGYAYIYLSNDNGQPLEVFFDDFTVEHVHSAIVQADDYYPFGLTFNEYRREKGMMNRYLYHSKELSLKTSSYDFHARMYDPALGRTFQIDPHSENYFSLSGYSWVDNNPLANMDPMGMDIQYGQGAFGGDLYTEGDMVKMLLSLQAQFGNRNEGEGDKDREKRKEKARTEVGQSGGGTGSVHPADVMRPEGGGYGYVGVSEGRNGKTYYKMSDNYGKLFGLIKIGKDVL